MLIQEHRGHFSSEVTEKAFKLLSNYMNDAQYHAFRDGMTVELWNKAKTHRVLFDIGGDFRLMAGAEGEGYEVTSGRIWEGRYPLGDEIATFLDWFTLKTQDLIANWNCGNFSSRGAEAHGMRRAES